MIYEAESGDLTLVASGDCMITRKLSVFREPSFVSLVDMFRKADVGYTNLEMLMHDFEHSPGSAGGTFTGSDPRNLEELKWAGINLVSTANNHAYDYGEGGVLTNLDNVHKSGIAYAGTGRNTSEARECGTKAEGRKAWMGALAGSLAGGKVRHSSSEKIRKLADQRISLS